MVALWCCRRFFLWYRPGEFFLFSAVLIVTYLIQCGTDARNVACMLCGSLSMQSELAACDETPVSAGLVRSPFRQFERAASRRL